MGSKLRKHGVKVVSWVFVFGAVLAITVAAVFTGGTEAESGRADLAGWLVVVSPLTGNCYELFRGGGVPRGDRFGGMARVECE